MGNLITTTEFDSEIPTEFFTYFPDEFLPKNFVGINGNKINQNNNLSSSKKKYYLSIIEKSLNTYGRKISEMNKIIIKNTVSTKKYNQINTSYANLKFEINDQLDEIIFFGNNGFTIVLHRNMVPDYFENNKEKIGSFTSLSEMFNY